MVEVPRTLRAVVRRRRSGWRVHVAPGGVLGVLAPVISALAMALALVLGLAGVALFGLVLPVGLTALVTLFAGDGGERLLAVGVLVALPLVLFIGWAMVVAAITLASGVAPFAVGFHRLDLRPATAPTRLVATGWLRRSVIEVVDLTRVIVRHSATGLTRPGVRELELVLQAGARTVVCPASALGPLRRADPAVLAGWLSEVLGPSEVAVCLLDGPFHDLETFPFQARKTDPEPLP